MAETMYCPRCATEVTDQVGFCRNCGLRLTGLMEFVGGESAKPVGKRRPNPRMMTAGMVTCLLALVIVMTNAALAPWIGLPEAYGRSLFLLMFGIGLAVVGFGMVLPQKAKRGSSLNARTSLKESMPGASMTNQLPPLHDSSAISIDDAFSTRDKVPSVTENTTRNLS